MYQWNPLNYNDIDYLKAVIVNAIAAPKYPIGYPKIGLSMADAQLFEKIVEDISQEYPQHRNYGLFLLSRLRSTGYTGQSMLYVPRPSKAMQFHLERHQQEEDQVLRDILDFLSRFDRWKLTSQIIESPWAAAKKKTYHIFPHIELKLSIDFDTDELLTDLGYEPVEKLMSVEDWDIPSPSNDELPSLPYLNITYDDDDDVFFDANDNEIDEEVVDEIRDAARWATESATSDNIWKEIAATLEQALMTFNDCSYTFWYIPAEETSASQDYMEGTAKGIQEVEVTPETTTIKTYPDLTLVIADSIYGRGLFHAIEEEWINDPTDYIKTRVHHLKYRWEIYGDRKPEMDFNNVEDFDVGYFRELIEGIEKSSGFKLL